ncbi:MAG: putative sulfate/molybdate transporter, partial [bacterium]
AGMKVKEWGKRFFSGRVRFDRNELSGAFGDIGTDLPLLLGLMRICGLDPASTLIMFGLLQIFTGIIYGIPMPVQPLKAMSVLMISSRYNPNLLYGAGLSIGVVMFFLTSIGLLEILTRIVPKSVVRGIQVGLGITLANTALKNFLPAEGGKGYLLAFFAFAIVVLLWGNRKYPPGLWVILLGVAYTLFSGISWDALRSGVGWGFPKFHIPARDDILQGFYLLALPQIPVSLSNSLIASARTARDLFGDKAPSLRKIGFTYSLMNLINPWFSGIPTCHGAGGMAGHYTFGARTGGSVIIYGSIYLLIGLFFHRAFSEVLTLFPPPILAVLLLFESVGLMALMRDIAGNKTDLLICLLTAMMCFGLPQGFVIGLILGSFLHYLFSIRGG